MEKEKQKRAVFNASSISKYLKANGRMPLDIGFNREEVTEKDVELIKGHTFDSITLNYTHVEKLSMLPKAKFYKFNQTTVGDFDDLALTDNYKRCVWFDNCPTLIPHLKFLNGWFNVVLIRDTQILKADGLENLVLKYNKAINYENWFGIDCLTIQPTTKSFMKSALEHLPKDIVVDLGNPEYPFEEKEWDRHYPLHHRCNIKARDCASLKKKFEAQCEQIANENKGERLLREI